MKQLLNFCLLLSSLIAYLEWGGGNSTFLFQAEYDILFGASGTKETFAHPAVLIPLAGQLALLITLFQKRPNRILTLIGLISLSLLILFIFFIGLLSLNFKMALSALPFIVVGFFVLRYNRRNRKHKKANALHNN
jgi:amino acid transporter